MRMFSQLLFMVVLVSSSISALVTGLGNGNGLKCEPIKIDQCSMYNSTGMPNLMGHQLQGDAKAGFDTFLPLTQLGCSDELLMFLCSVHVPMCVTLPSTGSDPGPAHTLIGPCRPLCQRVKKSCLRILQNFNKEWPESLSCERFPPSNNMDHMCMEGGSNLAGSSRKNVNNKYGGAGIIQTLQNHKDLIPKVKDLMKENPDIAAYNPIFRIIENSHKITPAKGFSHSDECSKVAYPAKYHYMRRFNECVPLCNEDIMFDGSDKHFAEIWITVWASLCFITTFFTILTFLLDTSVFLYPEKCIIFLNLSYFIMSLGYIIRLISGSNEVSCMSISDDRGSFQVLVKEGLTPTPTCTIVFILIYFSILSSAIWWIIITATWAVMVISSLSQTSLSQQAPLLHSIGWGIPAAMTVTCLVLHYVESDELTGVCLPGQQSESTLLYMLVIPCTIALGSAFLFFLAGLVASLIFTSENTRRLMGRISVFFVLYSVPQTCVVGSLMYELVERSGWRERAIRPDIEVFILRIFMMLVVGIISCSWCCTKKTLSSWESLVTSCCGVWSRAKKPSTPEFPKVAYQPTSGGGSDMISMGEMATLSRPSRPGFSQGQDGAPLLAHERRIVIGCQDTSRIVL